MSPALTREAPESVRRVRDVAIPVVAVVAFAALLAVVLRLVEPPATVDRVTVENRSAFDVEVGATGAGGGSVLELAALDAGGTTSVRDVLDQGSTWVVHVRRAGEPVGEIERVRARLQADDWRVVIPSSWDDRLAAAGPRPSGADARSANG